MLPCLKATPRPNREEDGGIGWPTDKDLVDFIAKPQPCKPHGYVIAQGGIIIEKSTRNQQRGTLNLDLIKELELDVRKYFTKYTHEKDKECW